jgi:hypothetical protein
VPASAIDARRPGAEQARERIRQQIRGWTLGKMVNEVLVEQEAARRGITPAALQEAVTGQTAVSDAKVEPAIPRGSPEGQVRGAHEGRAADEASLRNRRAESERRAQSRKVWDEFVATLRARAPVVVHLKGPDATPIALDPH